MKLSILLLTLPCRIDRFFPKIICELTAQAEKLNREDIEILALLDNRTSSIGKKRNDLLQLSQGDFVTFVDDDDIISPKYISSIIKMIDQFPTVDCIVFDSKCTIKNSLLQENDVPKSFICKYGLEFEYQSHEKDGTWYGKPAHTMVWNSRIAKKCKFPDKNRGEDVSWVSQAIALAKIQKRINEVLYYYNHDAATSASLDYKYVPELKCYLTREERKAKGIK